MDFRLILAYRGLYQALYEGEAFYAAFCREPGASIFAASDARWADVAAARETVRKHGGNPDLENGELVRACEDPHEFDRWTAPETVHRPFREMDLAEGRPTRAFYSRQLTRWVVETDDPGCGLPNRLWEVKRSETGWSYTPIGAGHD